MWLTSRLTSIKNAELFFLALGMMLASIPLSRFVMSVSQFTLLGLWFWHMVDHSYLSNYTPVSLLHPAVLFRFAVDSLARIYTAFVLKLKLFSRNKAALVLTSLYLLHIVGLIYTSNFDYAWKDLRVKIPLFLLPLLLSTGPKPSLMIQRILLLVFTTAVFIGTLISAYLLFTRIIADPRDISVFVSHIRFSMSICFSIFILGYFVAGHQFEKLWLKIIFCILICWFLLFLLLMESGTGIFITGLLVMAILLYLALKSRQPTIKLLSIGLIILFPLVGFLYVYNAVKTYSANDPVDIQRLDKYSPKGTYYIHDTIHFGVENGHYIGLYLAIPELRTAWNARSTFDFDGDDKRGQEIRYTLIRFLNSKGYRKDAEGVKRLTNEEVQYIEAGVANAEYIKKFSAKSLIYQFIPGYINYRAHGNPNASSAMQRLEYWRTSLLIIKQNWLTGVGTGDLPDAFTRQYQIMDSPLQQSFRWRSHNQYLSIFIAFGIFGLLWFLVTLIYPAIVTRRFLNYFYVIFWLIVIISMFTEDTLESQDGVTFYAFFNAFLLFSGDDSQNQE
jgi:O-Antigen ligase